MKDFLTISFDLAACRTELAAFRALLDGKEELEEAADIKPFFEAWREWTMNRYVGLVALFLGLMSLAPATADEGSTSALAKLAVARRDAARKTYEVMWANYRERRASEDILYRWSLRWLDAERQLSDQQADQVAAFRAHWERMRELERLITRLQLAGQTTVDEVSSTEYYRVEAEMWLMLAKDEKKKDQLPRVIPRE